MRCVGMLLARHATQKVWALGYTSSVYLNMHRSTQPCTLRIHLGTPDTCREVIGCSSEQMLCVAGGFGFMTKMFEICFRRKWALLALLVVPMLISLAIAYKLPRQYQASAGLWASRRYEIIGATGPESDLTNTPATTQATTLQELLQTRSFALAVAYATDLPKHIGVSGSNPETLQDALYTNISTNVVVTAVGYNYFQITYTNTDRQVALQVVRAVVSHYGTESNSQATAEGEQLLVSYESQLKVVQQQANQAAQAVAAYLQQQQLTLDQAQSDPKYQLLSGQASQANATLLNIENNIDTVNQQLATLSGQSTGLYQTIDAPTVPSQPQSRAKTLLLGGGIGLIIGLLASIGYYLLLSRMDQSIYSPSDIPDITEYPVLVQIPRLPYGPVAWVSQASREAHA
jgi:uncharacterized protein involved in exopolysaccharide biosynthesis